MRIFYGYTLKAGQFVLEESKAFVVQMIFTILVWVPLLCYTEKRGDLMWNAIDIIMGCFIPFLIGALMRYASRKWNRPLLVTGCLIFVLIAIRIVTNIIRSTFFRTFKIEVIIFACLILGTLTTDFIYRICSKQTHD